MRKLTLSLVITLLSFSAFAGVTTKAKIKRGKTEITVDLSANPQIKDYDVIFLDEGTYTTLGNFTAKYVRVRGQGTGKTIITSLPKESKPIIVNSTEFWDLTISDAQFRLHDQSGLWAMNVEFTGSIFVRPAAPDRSPSFTVRSAFSDLSKSDLPKEG